MQISIHSIRKAQPQQYFSQPEVYTLLGYEDKKIEGIFLNSGVTKRHLYIPQKDFHFDETLEELNQRRIEGSIFLGRNVLRDSLEIAELHIDQIGLINFVTSTCIFHPYIPFLLLSELDSSGNTELTNILGMSCTGALTAFKRAYEFLRENEDTYALIITIELCSTAYYKDETLETVVGHAIGSDGAATCLLTNKKNKLGPSIISFETFISPQHKDIVGFKLVDNRLRATISKSLAKIAGPLVQKTVSNLLEKNKVKLSEIKYWIFHPGGRKIIEAIQTSLGLTDIEMRYTKWVLENYGNMSSATILFAMADFFEKEKPTLGEYLVLAAAGPGLTVEACLLQW